MTEQTIKTPSATQPEKSVKKRRMRPLTRKEKCERFIKRNMHYIAAGIVISALAGLYGYKHYNNGYHDEGDQLNNFIGNRQLFVESRLHGGSTSVPKDMGNVAVKLKALPKGISETPEGLVSSYGTKATLLSYGRAMEISYYGLTKAQCAQAAKEENRQANSLSINGSFEFTSTNAARYVPSLCVLSSNKVSWSIKR